VYDLDDALFIGSSSSVNRSFQWAKQDARRCVAYLRRAKLVIAGNAFLADYARRHARRVESPYGNGRSCDWRADASRSGRLASSSARMPGSDAAGDHRIAACGVRATFR
jgi:hypothetical protein